MQPGGNNKTDAGPCRQGDGRPPGLSLPTRFSSHRRSSAPIFMAITMSKEGEAAAMGRRRVGTAVQGPLVAFGRGVRLTGIQRTEAGDASWPRPPLAATLSRPPRPTGATQVHNQVRDLFRGLQPELLASKSSLASDTSTAHKKLQSLPCPVRKAALPPLHGCVPWAACFHPTALTEMHGQFPSFCVPPRDPLCRCSGAPPHHGWAPALCQARPRMETRGQWALPLPSRGSGLVGGTVRCFTHKNSTQHLLTPPW